MAIRRFRSAAPALCLRTSRTKYSNPEVRSAVAAAAYRSGQSLWNAREDTVEIENLSRSPIFIVRDVGMMKVDATALFLREMGYSNVTTYPHSLDQVREWQRRGAGSPDFVISAANERNVRQIIEEFPPPFQIYGTTGTNSISAMIRHEIGVGACSCCLFPPTDEIPQTKCATGHLLTNESDEPVDAALPFLSFAAGLMAACEIVKSNLSDYPFTTDRVVMNFLDDGRMSHARVPIRRGCECRSRSPSLVESIRKNSRLAGTVGG